MIDTKHKCNWDCPKNRFNFVDLCNSTEFQATSILAYIANSTPGLPDVEVHPLEVVSLAGLHPDGRE